MLLKDIKGFGAKRIQKLNEAGLYDPADLLMIFPYKYVFSDNKIDDFADGEEANLVAQCTSEPTVKFVRKGLSLVRATFSDGIKSFACIWFNRPFVKKQLVVGERYAVVGKIKRGKTSAEVYVSSSSSALDRNIIPLYKPYRDIPAKVIKEAIAQVRSCVTVHGQISDKLCRENGILPINSCINVLHDPQNRNELFAAKSNAALQILAYNIASFSIFKGENAQNKRKKYADNRENLRKVINSLPFVLTEDQLGAIWTIVDDLHGDRRMNRLIEGDVGCGKTVVAFLAMYYAALSGYQAALMAPTEILARQHFAKALEFFAPLGITCELLCGGRSGDGRAEALFNIETGNALIVIGTHSLFQEAVKFKNLALTVADEQQRFGVEQRGSLENKGVAPDSLVMSATPIPRTLALTLYGDLDLSLIRTVPKDKAKIITKFVPRRKESDMFDYLNRKADEGEKSYVVCPRVDDEENISALTVYNELKKRFGEKVGLVHGRMKDEEKNKIMEKFSKGKVMILVSTTVIEVGIDVPDAVNIVIYDAEMYGLSQLHQLRGRVGRGVKDSYCFVISKDDNPDSRLRYFMNTNNGFELAEYDFKMRGAGDFLGKRQHGSDSIFADISINEDLLDSAKELSEKLILSGEVEAGSAEFIKGLTLN